MPQEKANFSAYTLRNRVLRYGKQFRAYVGAGFKKTNSTSPFNACLLFGLTAVGLILIFWCGANLTFSRLRTVIPDAPSSATKTTNDGKESQIDEPSFDLLTLGMIDNDTDRQKKEQGMKDHAFNTLISERIGLRRPIPDTRHELCRNQSFDLPSSDQTSWDTSVIICFFNEDFHTLQRTLYTVLERTPAALLREIILINDYSDNNVARRLEQYRQSLEGKTQLGASDDAYLRKVRYYRVPERSGLIRARLYGTQFAGGRVLFFLDSHCEVNQQWLEPLLTRIVANRKTVVCPIIDIIEPDTFVYTSSVFVKGGFNWGLHFKWDSLPKEQLRQPEDFIKPIKSPTMAGGLFAVERNYFHEIGTYDRGMDIWGGENIELSFRVWMCGGQLEIVPCSRIGHVFRHRRPYGAPDGADTWAHNSLRVANVWMDDYKKYFLQSDSRLETMEYGNIQERVDLRAKLNCSSFKWYLRSVYPEMLTPEEMKRKQSEEKGAQNPDLFHRKAQKIIAKFTLSLATTKLCLESESDMTYKGTRLYLAQCDRRERRQHWKKTEIHDIRLGPRSCLQVSHGKGAKISLSKCHEMGGTQLWQIDSSSDSAQLYNPGTGLCLAVESSLSAAKLQVKLSSDKLTSSLKIVMAYCNRHNVKQEDNSWIFARWNLQPI